MALRQAAEQPHVVMWVCFCAVVAGAWVYLAILSPSGFGAGYAGDLLRSLCLADDDAWSRQSLLAAFAMWSAMILAMMLPSAAPMLATYMDICETADEKAMAIPSPFVLGGGYLSVWLVFSVAMTSAQAALQQHGMLGANEALAHPFAAAVVLAGAGLYQFTPYKHACLQKCAHPMPWFLANWCDTPGGVLMMGVRQGLFCLGCCWAMMLVMFVTGLMNLFWMAAIALVMIAEKTLANARPVSYGSGLGLIAAGAVMCGYAVLR
jgi:predicted metal-binding membrane protein